WSHTVPRLYGPATCPPLPLTSLLYPVREEPLSELLVGLLADLDVGLLQHRDRARVGVDLGRGAVLRVDRNEGRASHALLLDHVAQDRDGGAVVGDGEALRSLALAADHLADHLGVVEDLLAVEAVLRQAGDVIVQASPLAGAPELAEVEPVVPLEVDLQGLAEARQAAPQPVDGTGPGQAPGAGGVPVDVAAPAGGDRRRQRPPGRRAGGV